MHEATLHSAMDNGEAATAVSPDLAGRHLTFRLGQQEYGVGVLKVREIVRVMKITRVPQMAPWVRGVINLRGKVLHVLDLRRRFGLGETEVTDQTVIVVVQLKAGARELLVGVLVDEVLEVLMLSADQIGPLPQLHAAGPEIDFIRGVGQPDSRIVFLLDLDRVLSGEEARQVHRTDPVSPAAPRSVGS